MWEYPCKALALPKEIMAVDFLDFTQKKQNSIDWTFETSGSCNGIAIWTDWVLTESDNVVTTGPISSVTVGEIIDWDFHTRQGVHLLPNATVVQPNMQIFCDASFLPSDGNMDFKFNIK